jgi:hypothetical protein
MQMTDRKMQMTDPPSATYRGLGGPILAALGMTTGWGERLLMGEVDVSLAVVKRNHDLRAATRVLPVLTNDIASAFN